MKSFRRGLLWVWILIIATVSGIAIESEQHTVLERDGWNLISICADINKSEVNMTGIEEIQSQNGLTIYTGEYAELSNLNTLYAGYGYWIKGQVGTSFNGGESRSNLVKPLTRNGWNLMASCENIPRAEIEMNGISEIQSQTGDTIYTGQYAAQSNLDTLRRGYGYWVYGNEGTKFTSKRGLSIPSEFIYPTINNSNNIVDGSLGEYTIKVFANYEENLSDQSNHTTLAISINDSNESLALQIQGTYRGHDIVVAVYNTFNELVAVSENIYIGSSASVTSISLNIEDPYGNGGGTDPYGNGGGYDPYGNGGGTDPYGNGGGYDPYGNGGGYDPYGNGGGYDPYGNGGGYDPYGNGGGTDPYGNGGGDDPYGTDDGTDPYLNLSESYIEMHVGEVRTISYDANNVYDIRLNNAPDFVTIDEENRTITIDATNLVDSQSFSLDLRGGNQNGEFWANLYLNITIDELTKLKNKLAGKTYYLPYVDSNGTNIIRELIFDDNLSTINWQEVEGGSASGTSTIRLDYSTLILDEEMSFYIDLYNDENQPLNVYFYRNIMSEGANKSNLTLLKSRSKLEITKDVIAGFLEGSFKLFSSQEEVHSYLSTLLAGQTLYIPNYSENRIDEVVFDEGFTTITRETTDSIVGFGDRLSIGENGVMTLRYAYSDYMYFDYQDLDENNQTVYETIETYTNSDNAQQQLDYYNSQTHVYLSENNINMNMGEVRTITYTTRNVDSVRLDNAPDFVTLDEASQMITIDATTLEYNESFYIQVVGMDNTTNNQTWSYIWVNINGNGSDPYGNGGGSDPYGNGGGSDPYGNGGGNDPYGNGGGSDPYGNGGGDDPYGAVTVSISGHITYDRVHPKSDYNGLDFDNITQENVRQVILELIDGSGNVIATTTTDDNGEYIFANLEKNLNVKVRVNAKMFQEGDTAWDVKVVDNTNSYAMYVMDGAMLSTGDNNSIRNLNAGSTTRTSAAFAILDNIYDGMEKVLLANGSSTVFPALVANWSVNNKASGGDVENGEIGTSYYSNGTLFILGDIQGDSDEYDDHVIAHEWGHYYEDKFSRSDSIGGSHGSGDHLDIRVAFGEGFGNAMSAISIGNPIYFDTYGENASTGWYMNIENSTRNNPGWFSESSVQRILYDLYDGDDDGVDNLSLGFSSLHNIFVNAQKNTEAFTSIFSFITALKAENPDEMTAIDAIVSSESIATITDIYGAGRTNLASETPLYADLTLGATVNVCTSNTYGSYNKLGNRKYVRFSIPNGGTYTIIVQQSNGSNTDPDFNLYKTNLHQYMGSAESEEVGVESKSFSLSEATNYLLDISDYLGKEAPCFNVTINPES